MTALTPAALAEMESRAREALAAWTVLAPDAHADVLALLAYVRELEAERDELSFTQHQLEQEAVSLGEQVARLGPKPGEIPF